MRPIRLLATSLVVLIAWSCTEEVTQPELSSYTDAEIRGAIASFDGVRVTEIRYHPLDESKEAVEVAGRAGTSLAGWKVVLYNGASNSRAAYSTRNLTGTIPDQCAGAGTVVFTYNNMLQNGSPDGLALVDPSGVVVDFLSWEGSFVAANGPAAGMTSTDIGVSHAATPVSQSLQRVSLTEWIGPADHTLGTCSLEAEEPVGAFISELHYQNVGTDVGEAVEVSAPADVSLEGWSVVQYTSQGGVSGTRTLTGLQAEECDGLRRVVLEYPTDGLRNGPGDGLALVDAQGRVVELLSYGGTFRAAGGPASGRTSTDIGVSQSSTTPIGQTLQRDSANGAWHGPTASTWGCNRQNTDPVFLSEIRADALETQAENEYLEIGGAPGASLTGVSLIVVAGSASNGGVVEEVTPLSGSTVGASGALVVGDLDLSSDFASADLATSLRFDDHDNPTFLLVRDFTGTDGDDLDANDDGVLDVTPWSAVVDCVSLVHYLGRMPIYCSARVGMDGVATPGHVTRGDAGWFADALVQSSGSDTPGALEFDPASAVAGVIAPWGVRPHGQPTRLAASPADVRLPVGFNRALFVRAYDDYNDAVADPSVTFTTTDASVLTTDQSGNVRAEGVGGASLVVALAGDATVQAIARVEVIADVPSDVVVQNHLEVGAPVDATPADERLIVRDEYALSLGERGSANWVAWNLDASHTGTESDCECYTPEPMRADGTYGVVNADYTNTGYVRGHFASSVERTVTLPDNAATFYTSNVFPQAAANRDGPWASFETFVTDRARAGAEVYLVAGGQYTDDATLNDAGRVRIPSWTWQVALIVQRDGTLADVTTREDVELIAIRTPNRLESGAEGSVAGISSDWGVYELEVDELEALIGYDLLALLPDAIEAIVESGFDELEDAYASVEASLRHELRNALGHQLELAAARLAAGEIDEAIARIETFLNQLDVFVRNRKLDRDVAAALRAEAERVLAVIR